MMKLQYLLDNRELAIELLQNWTYDPLRMDVLNQYRISSNAVYPFYQDGKVCFLRFAPEAEKTVVSVQSELDFMAYLRSNGFSTSEPIPSREGKDLLVCPTEMGNYIAVVFKCAVGKKIEGLAFDERLFEQYGKTMGQMHKLSSSYRCKGHKRANWEQQLTWVEACFLEFKAPQSALRELLLVREALQRLPVTTSNFGLIHYDFELDNVFYDAQTDLFTTIDFDDAVYHWFAMDVVQTLNNLQEELDSAQVEIAKNCFLDGYQTVMDLPPELMSQFGLFERYAGLYQYARCMRATYEHLDNEPEWMVNLRTYLATLMQKHEKGFNLETDKSLPL
ncbi:MAG: phosphotransferase [Candidatus Cloacimonas sp.]|jgi:Ser/Thr protein kinase RdoA (MazF antagonist)|nr:phosphotransferase [Candidatus Cloacimonas sp.]